MIISLNKQKENLNEILNEFQNQNEENTRLIDSLHEVDSSVYKTEVDSYKKENSRLQKANGILISEIKDLLVMCYDHRRVGCTLYDINNSRIQQIKFTSRERFSLSWKYIRLLGFIVRTV